MQDAFFLHTRQIGEKKLLHSDVFILLGEAAADAESARRVGRRRQDRGRMALARDFGSDDAGRDRGLGMAGRGCHPAVRTEASPCRR